MTKELTKPINLAQYNGVDLVAVRKDAKKYPRIAATSFDEAVAKMTLLVHAAALYRGQDLSELTIRFIANALVSEILSDTRYNLPALSWEEIGIAIRAAVLEGTQNFYGVSVASLYAALVAYVKGEGHEASVRANYK